MACLVKGDEDFHFRFPLSLQKERKEKKTLAALLCAMVLRTARNDIRWVGYGVPKQGEGKGCGERAALLADHSEPVPESESEQAGWDGDGS